MSAEITDLTKYRIEARIGQLLGDTANGERHDLKGTFPRAERLSPVDRNRFRQLARAAA